MSPHQAHRSEDVRVLENPVCRYSTLVCQTEFGVNPLDADCGEQFAQLPPDRQEDAAMCCSNEKTTPSFNR